MNQDDDYTRAIQEAIRGVLAYAETGKCPRLSICGDRPVTDDRHYRAVEAVVELRLDWEVLDGSEVASIIEASLRET